MNYNQIDTYINREGITEKLRPFINKRLIKFLVGMRRVGKSFVLGELERIIRNIDSNADINVIYIDKESYKFDFIKNYHDLVAYIEQHSSDKHNLLFIDEVQEIEGFENGLRHFYSKDCYDIYCTGSNASLLSGELATKLSGRYIKIEINSLSFSEFTDFTGNNNLLDYCKFGGMPFLRVLPLEQDIVYNYLKSVYESIILRDVSERYNLRNIRFLENIVKFLCCNIGSLISAKSIADYLKSQRSDISVNTVISYIEALKNCYLIHEVLRYDIKGKSLFSQNHKYYIEDIGIRNTIVGYNEANDLAMIIENIVYMHLKRSGYQVYVGVLGDKEIDFVATKQNEISYFQVALRVDNDSTMKREFGNLLEIKDNYPKYVVTLDSSSLNSISGIKHLSLTDFLKIVR